MKWIKTFENYTGCGGNLDKTTINYCEGKISDEMFLQYLDTTNEGLSEMLSGFKQKIIDVFYSFLVKSTEIGFAIFDKISTFIKWLLGKIRDWREKNPKLWRIVVITAVILILLIVSASTAKAATTGQPIPLNKIDLAIGWLDSLKGGKEDPVELGKAIAHLVDLRDGKIDLADVGQKATQLADAALNTAQKMIDDSKGQTDPGFFKFCLSLIEKGKDYVSAEYTNIGNIEKVKLVVK